MPSTVFSSLSGHETTIRVNGRFNYEVFSRFRAAYLIEGSDRKCSRRLVIDLAGTEYIDSSGMDMLLLMRDEMGRDGASIEIVNLSPEIRNFLEIACFDRLFKMT
ncbi:MAG: STAS domain-containing protein [Magnetococcus sp. YQC-5]